MKKRIAIFGPPGVGKSTLIKVASRRRIKAYDLEKFPSEERLKQTKKIFLKDFDGIVLFNAADLQPSDFPPDVELVLLLPPKNIFLERSRKRDERIPIKKGQNASDFYDGFACHQELFHKVIKDVMNPDRILNKVLKD